MNIVTKHMIQYWCKEHKWRRIMMLMTGVILSLGFGIVASEGISDDTITELANLNSVRTYSITYTENGEFTTIDSNDGEPLIFEAGSLGKPVTAYLCMKLVAEGKLSLDDSIVQYLNEPWITNDIQWNNITIRQLLSHTAGLSPSYEMGIDKSIYFEPGKYFSYSGVGYIYLQQVIETATGETFEQLAQQYVFTPLDMRNSTFAAAGTVTPFVNTSSLVLYIILVWCVIAFVVFILGLIIGLVTKFKFFSKRILFYISVLVGFICELVLLTVIIPRMVIPAFVFDVIGLLILWVTRKSKKLFFAIFLCFIVLCSILGLLLPISLPVGPEIMNRKPNAAYSLKSTSEDIAIFANELLSIYHNGTSKTDYMLKEQIAINDRNSWGLGIAIEKDNKTTTYWHSGINPGMQSLFVIHPESSTVVAVMTNSDNGLLFATAVAQDILGVKGVWEIERVDLSQLK